MLKQLITIQGIYVYYIVRFGVLNLMAIKLLNTNPNKTVENKKPFPWLINLFIFYFLWVLVEITQIDYCKLSKSFETPGSKCQDLPLEINFNSRLTMFFYKLSFSFEKDIAFLREFYII